MSSPLPYVRAFDGLRAGAVLLVVFSHWPLAHWQVPLGWVGVPLFFVLSGFLITRLLVADRARPLGAFLRRFYWRRTLRIFPLYYGYLFVAGGGVLLAAAILTHDPPWLTNWARAVRTDGPWLLTYLYNWQDLIHWLDGQPDSQSVRAFNHLWSLSVEEQFYLTFPLLVWWLPPARLRTVLLVLVLTGPLLRAGVGEALRGVPAAPAVWAFFVNRATPFYLDALALGGLLALGAGARLRQPGRWLLGASVAVAGWNLAVMAVNHYALGRDWPSWRWLGYEHPLLLYVWSAKAPLLARLPGALLPTLLNLQAALLLLWAARGGPTVQRWLEKAPLRYVGRISYGVYVWHMPLTLLVQHGPAYEWLKTGWLPETLGLLLFLAVVGGVATVSYYGLERPFLRLKERGEK